MGGYLNLFSCFVSTFGSGLFGFNCFSFFGGGKDWGQRFISVGVSWLIFLSWVSTF